MFYLKYSFFSPFYRPLNPTVQGEGGASRINPPTHYVPDTRSTILTMRLNVPSTDTQQESKRLYELTAI